MLDLFGDPLKVKKRRKPRKTLAVFASASQNSKRYQAVVLGSRVETICATVSVNSCVWIALGPTPRETRAAINACKRLKRAGYRHVYAEAPANVRTDDHAAKGSGRAVRRRSLPGGS